MRFRLFIIAVCAALPMTAVSFAREATVADLVRFTETGHADFKASVLGGGRALEAANLLLEIQNKPSLFCQPRKLVITGDQWERILSAYVEENPKDGQMAIGNFGWVLLQAAIAAFPCD